MQTCGLQEALMLKNSLCLLKHVKLAVSWWTFSELRKSSRPFPFPVAQHWPPQRVFFTEEIRNQCTTMRDVIGGAWCRSATVSARAVIMSERRDAMLTCVFLGCLDSPDRWTACSRSTLLPHRVSFILQNICRVDYSCRDRQWVSSEQTAC